MINNLPPNMLTKIKVQDCDAYGLIGMCWIWTGCLNSKGYGCVQFGGKRNLVHRVSYELHTGQIPVGMQIDHLCRRTACLNPHHLEAVTGAENIRRAKALAFDAAFEADEEESDELASGWFSSLVSAS